MLLLIQLAWASLLLLSGIYVSVLGNLFGLALGAAALAYGYSALALRRGRPWAWWASWLMPIAALVLVAPGAFYNFYLFFAGDNLYSDSPGTILAVLVSTVAFVMPAIAIIWLLLSKRTLLVPNSSLERP